MTRLALLLFAPALLSAADFSGTWIGQMQVRKDQMQDVAIKITQNGTAVTGKLYGDYQSSPIIEGHVTGDDIEFVVLVPEQAGNQINETRLRFTGTFKNGELDMIRLRERANNAGNGGAVQFKGDGKITFHLKRLI